MSCSGHCIPPSLGSTSVLKKHDTSASGPDGVAGVRCILLPETTGRRARLTQEWTSGSTGCDCEKGTGEFPDARKGESGNTWDVTNMFIKRGYQEATSFYYTKDSHSLPRRVFHSEGRLSGLRSFLPVGVRQQGCTCAAAGRVRPSKSRLQRAPVCVFQWRYLRTTTRRLFP